MDHEEERRRGEIRSEREAELVTRLSKVEEEGERLGQEVARLAAASRQEVAVRRKENKMNVNIWWALTTLLIAATRAQVISDLDVEQADRRSASASAQNGNGKRCRWDWWC